jgi:hypothetical protein
VLLHLVFYSGFTLWWAGYSYGPRYLADVLPALAICAVPAVERLSAARAGRVLLATLALWGVVVQVIGVYFDDNTWNRYPASVEQHPERLWQWRDPQILRALQDGFHGVDGLPLLWQTATGASSPRLAPIDASQLAGSVVLGGSGPWRAEAGGILPVELQVTNSGAATWPAFSEHGYGQVAVVYRWSGKHRAKSPYGDFEERQTFFFRGLEAVPLLRNLAPGESIDIAAPLRAPGEPGSYSLDIIVAQLLGETSLTFIATASTPVEVR